MLFITVIIALIVVNSESKSSRLSDDVAIPTESQVWYQQAEIHALIHFNMATFWHHSDHGCYEENWVNGSSHASSFAPKHLNTSQWADVMVDLGAKGAILTAKHNCGFLLWPSKTKLPNGTRYPFRVSDDLNVLKQFQHSMEERDIGHGFYYSLTNNFFLDVFEHKAGASLPPLPGQVNVSQSEFESLALQQVTELWTQFGNLTEIWFDGGYTSDMAKNLTAVLEKHQPGAIGFGGQGVCSSPSNWIGTESGHPDCPGGIWYDDNEGHGCGNFLNSSSAYIAKTCDTTLQNGDTWFWNSDNPNDIRTLDELIDVYHDTVGNGCTLELDFAIDRDGLVNKVHADRYRVFGDWIRSCYGSPYEATISGPKLLNGTYIYNITFNNPVLIDRISLREDIRHGQRVRSFFLLEKADPSIVVITSGTSIGNRRIKLLSEPITAQAFELSVSAIAKPMLSHIEFFAPC